MRYIGTDKYYTMDKKDRIFELERAIIDFEAIGGFERMIKLYKKQLKELQGGKKNGI